MYAVYRKEEKNQTVFLWGWPFPVSVFVPLSAILHKAEGMCFLSQGDGRKAVYNSHPCVNGSAIAGGTKRGPSLQVQEFLLISAVDKWADVYILYKYTYKNRNIFPAEFYATVLHRKVYRIWNTIYYNKIHNEISVLLATFKMDDFNNMSKEEFPLPWPICMEFKYWITLGLFI